MSRFVIDPPWLRFSSLPVLLLLLYLQIVGLIHAFMCLYAAIRLQSLVVLLRKFTYYATDVGGRTCRLYIAFTKSLIPLLETMLTSSAVGQG